jgi:hypothetical protein
MSVNRVDHEIELAIERAKVRERVTRDPLIVGIRGTRHRLHPLIKPVFM